MNYLLPKLFNLRRCVRGFIVDLGKIISPESQSGYALDVTNSSLKSPSLSLRDIIGDGFLYGVPKGRRTIEKRLTRKHGFGKMILPKKTLIKCDTCGHFHPVHAVCGNCYEKVKKETECMQDAIMKELKLDPIDKEVVVLYENDPQDSSSYNGKRIVELPKKRPEWFSQNLLVRDSGTQRNTKSSVGSHQPQPLLKKD